MTDPHAYCQEKASSSGSSFYYSFMFLPPERRQAITALYAADADGGAPAAVADAMWTREYSTLPGATLTRVDGSRHFIMADQPRRFAEAVDRFLAD